MKLFQTVDPAFVRANFKDPTLAEAIIRADQRRAAITKIVVGSFLLIALVAIGYALNKQSMARSFQMQALTLVNQADSCQQQANQQMQQAAASRQQAEEMSKKIQQQLEDCLKKTRKK
jgi:hypothetical protein